MLLTVNKRHFDLKPTRKDTAIIMKEFKKDISVGELNRNVQLNELKEIIENGQTLLLAQFKNEISMYSEIIGQDIVMLDFDNDGKDKYTREEILKDKYIREFGLFIYDTFNNTENTNRFRIGFRLSNTVKDSREITAIYNDLNDSFVGLVDDSIKHSTRIFYGGSNFEVINKNNVLDISWLSQVELEDIDYEEDMEKINSNSEDNDIIRLFRNKDYKTIKNVMVNKFDIQKSFKNYNEFTEFVKKSIDISDFLELPKDRLFLDIFHNEKNPSSNIFKDKVSKNYLYKCFSKSNPLVLDIFGILEQFDKDLNRFESTTLLADLLNVDIISDREFKKLSENVSKNVKYLVEGTFEYDYPYMNLIIDNYKNDMVNVLNLMINFRYIDFKTKGKTEIINFMSQQYIAKTLNINESRAKRAINLLALFDFITKEDKNNVDKTVLDIIKKYKTNEDFRDVSIYRLNIVDIKVFNRSEKMANELFSKDFNILHLTHIYLKNTLGQDVADKVFKNVNKTNEFKTNNLEKTMIKYIMSDINKKGYCLESDLVAKLKRYSKDYSNTNYKSAKFNVKDDYGLEYNKVNKTLKKELNIDKNTTTHVYYNA